MDQGPRPFLDRHETAVLFADLQVGIADLSRTVDGTALAAGVKGLVSLTSIFALPAVVTAVQGQDGSPPRFIPELAALDAAQTPHVRTTPKSFSDPGTRAAIAATRKRTLVIAGVATEVVVSLAALAAVAEGYTAYVALDACGGLSERSERAAIERMIQAGVRMTSLAALVGELAGTFDETQTQQGIGVLFGLASAKA